MGKHEDNISTNFIRILLEAFLVLMIDLGLVGVSLPSLDSIDHPGDWNNGSESEKHHFQHLQ